MVIEIVSIAIKLSSIVIFPDLQVTFLTKSKFSFLNLQDLLKKTKNNLFYPINIYNFLK